MKVEAANIDAFFESGGRFKDDLRKMDQFIVGVLPEMQREL